MEDICFTVEDICIHITFSIGGVNKSPLIHKFSLQSSLLFSLTTIVHVFVPGHISMVWPESFISSQMLRVMCTHRLVTGLFEIMITATKNT